MIIKNINYPSFNLKINILKSVYLLCIDGNTASQRRFWDACQTLNSELKAHFPINSSYVFKDKISITSICLESPLLDEIEAIPNFVEGTVEINLDTLYSALKQIFIKELDKDLFSILVDGNSRFTQESILVLLLPTTQSENGLEAEFISNDGDKPNIYVTSRNLNWSQFIYRILLKSFGLADEFERDGESFLNPDFGQGEILEHFHYNLIHVEEDSQLIDKAKEKWQHLMSEVNADVPTSIQKSPLHPTNADFSIPHQNYFFSKIQLWEGGGGYRTKMYRSAQDCLMRRQIGNKQLPVRKGKVPLCPACEHYLKTKLIEEIHYDADLSFEFHKNLIQVQQT